jgi:hypothetical protein
MRAATGVVLAVAFVLGPPAAGQSPGERVLHCVALFSWLHACVQRSVCGKDFKVCGCVECHERIYPSDLRTSGRVRVHVIDGWPGCLVRPSIDTSPAAHCMATLH